MAYCLARYLTQPEERRRYESALRRLSMRPVTPRRLADRAKLAHRLNEIRHALRDDPRYERVHEDGPERYVLRREHRHAASLRGAQA